MQFKYTTSAGALTLDVEGDVVIARFSGNVCTRIARYFVSKISDCAKQIDEQNWGYISYSKDVIAATPEAFELFVDAGHEFRRCGAVCDAYVLLSPIAIHQMDKVRKRLGIPQPIEQALFPDIEQAKVYIQQVLAMKRAQFSGNSESNE